MERAPLNAEAPLEVLDRPLTPSGLFYVRNHFDVPEVDAAGWRLRVEGAVARPLELSVDALGALPARTEAVTLECAGNGRRFVTPRPPGTPWGLGAVSTARFTGVPLADVLDRAGVGKDAREVVFSGADRGPVASGRTVAFERSLPVAEARRPEVLLAWAMDDRPLPPEHGFPLRLVVPGWYAMASVKWLSRIRVSEEPFRGWFQRDRYVYLGEEGVPDGTPVRRMRPRALIARPANGAALPPGAVEVVGSAWSGTGPIRRVQVSADGGAEWRDADLDPPAGPHAATPWRWRWDATPGEHELVARAIDSAGRGQPMTSRRNRLGYGNNVASSVRVRVG